MNPSSFSSQRGLSQCKIIMRLRNRWTLCPGRSFQRRFMRLAERCAKSFQVDSTSFNRDFPSRVPAAEPEDVEAGCHDERAPPLASQAHHPAFDAESPG